MSIEELRNINDEFNNRLKPLITGNNNDFNPLNLGNPCKYLLDAGLPDLPIQMSVQRLIDKKLQSNHPFRIVSVVHLPEYLANPIAVFQSKTQLSSKVVLLEMNYNNTCFVVAIEPDRLIGNQRINSIRSIYPKDNNKDVLRWIAEDNLLETCNKEKILDWISKQQSNSADVANLIKDAVKIVNNK